MKNHANRRSVGMKTFVAMLALVLVIGCAVGGTVAWLTAQTDSVVNTFTYGDIKIDLTETKPENNQAKIIPGVNIDKNPTVTVKKDSEACWLFVEVKEGGTFVADKVTYSIADGWTQGDGKKIPKDVYYREVGAAESDASFAVLEGNKIYVREDLTKEDIKNIDPQSTLTFTAYASQLHKDATTEFTPAEAWANVNPTNP